MLEETCNLLLRNPEQKPDDSYLKNALTPSVYEVLKDLVGSLTAQGIDFE